MSLRVVSSSRLLRPAKTVWAMQTINALWTVVFAGNHCFGTAFVIISALLLQFSAKLVHNCTRMNINAVLLVICLKIFPTVDYAF